MVPNFENVEVNFWLFIINGLKPIMLKKQINVH